MEKKRFNVVCTMIHNGNIEVQAESEEDALNIVNRMLSIDKSCANWVFGEITADYIEEV